jgi:MraZ protein
LAALLRQHLSMWNLIGPNIPLTVHEIPCYPIINHFLPDSGDSRMALFLSTHTNKVDAKGRVSVPASFRTALTGDAFQGVVLIPSAKLPALEGFGMATMQNLSERFDRFDLFSTNDGDDLASIAFFGDAKELTFDDTGRIGIPKEMLVHAKITDAAVFVGLGTKFQIWEPKAFAARRTKAMQHMQKNGQGG